MSSIVCKYYIVYDSNNGMTYDKYIYCKQENVSDMQMWVNEDGTPVDFAFCSDCEALVTAYCIANILTNNKHYYWKAIKEFDLPEAVAKAFNYVYPLHIKRK